VPVRLPDGQEIRIFSLPYLIASKLEAFKDRGHDDFMGSSVFGLNRERAVLEVNVAPGQMDEFVTWISAKARSARRLERPTRLRSRRPSTL